MKNIQWRLVMGGFLLGLGGLMLLQTMGILPNSGDMASMLFSVFFMAGGAIFLMHLFQNTTQNWWAVIPGCVLLGIGLLIFGDNYFPKTTDMIGGGMFLGSIAVAFWITYFLNRNSYWWALIPAGVLTTLALIAIDPISRAVPAEFLFFFGLSATFAAIALFVKPKESYSWAWIPSGILFAIALIIGTTSSRMQIAFPVLLILVGIVVLILPFISPKLKRGQDE